MSCKRCGEYSVERLCDDCIEVLEKTIQCIENHCGTNCVTSGLDVPTFVKPDCELGTLWCWKEVGRTRILPALIKSDTCCCSANYPLECIKNYLSGKQLCGSAIIFTEAYCKGKFYLKTIEAPLIKNAYNFRAYLFI